jgi:hypothetical protein
MKNKFALIFAGCWLLTVLGGCDSVAEPDMSHLVTALPTDAAELKALNPMTRVCLESAGHWDKNKSHCLITQKLCEQIGDWKKEACVIPVTDCIEEGSHKRDKDCVIEYYSQEHMQTLVNAAQ